MDAIKVFVVKYPDRNSLVLCYTDKDGKHKAKGAGTTIKRDAERAAAVWERELRAGIVDCGKVTWVQFRERYENEVLASLAENTDKKVQGVFNAVEKYLAPVRLRDVTADRLSYLQAKLREAEKSNDTIKKRSENTIKGHLAHLMSALRWAVKVGMLAKAPEVTMPKRAKGANVMKGRPISGEDFDRMLEAVAKVLGDEKNPAEPAMVKSWQHYLRGLWLSGLRLAESLELSLGTATTSYARTCSRVASHAADPCGAGKGQSRSAAAHGARVRRVFAGNPAGRADWLRVQTNAATRETLPAARARSGDADGC
jgi:hypothetical protein